MGGCNFPSIECDECEGSGEEEDDCVDIIGGGRTAELNLEND
jgi:hypothetical protein